MNIHHLELFYYVARHGGITEAVRNIPYGIQQPAVSGQVAQLEEYLGVTLFQRRPFALTPAGEKLYQFIQPFFANLDLIASELQGGKARQIRIGASTIVLRDHLPEVFQNVRKRFPNLKISLREGYPADFEKPAAEGGTGSGGDGDREEARAGPSLAGAGRTAAGAAGAKRAAGSPRPSSFGSGTRSRSRSSACPPRRPSRKNFQQGLARLGVDWFPSIEVSSVDLIETYVAERLRHRRVGAGAQREAFAERAGRAAAGLRARRPGRAVARQDLRAAPGVPRRDSTARQTVRLITCRAGSRIHDIRASYLEDRAVCS